MTPATKRKIAVQKGCAFQLRSRKERRFEFRAFLPKVDIRTAAAGILNTPDTQVRQEVACVIVSNHGAS